MIAQVREGMRTPWGAAQTVERMAPGIWIVSTAGHGGIKLDAAHQRQMPAYMRRGGGWYEEDCESALPMLVFATEILAAGVPWACKSIQDGRVAAQAKEWYPDEYEQFTGQTVTLEESYKRRKAKFYADHAGQWLVVCAYGDWKEGVPEGCVGVVARQGGHEAAGPEKYFLVPRAEYDQRGEFCFVIDPQHHLEVTADWRPTKQGSLADLQDLMRRAAAL